MAARPVSMHLVGGEELLARLNGIMQTSAVYLDAWAGSASDNMRAKIHSPTGRMRRSIHPRSPGQVWGDWRVTFIDKGTSEHDIKPKPDRKSANPRHAAAVGFGWGTGRSHYARKLHVRGARRRPFIRTAARKAYTDTPPSQVMIDLWNDAGVRPRKYLLGARQAADARYKARLARRALP